MTEDRKTEIAATPDNNADFAVLFDQLTRPCPVPLGAAMVQLATQLGVRARATDTCRDPFRH